jgi:uncharacterized protein YbjQ (UPF0145 family)
MKLYTIENVPGIKIEKVFGLVKGEIVQSKHIGKDIMASFKTIVGGEILGYTEMIREARNQATYRMIQEAQKMGANAIIGIRYGSSEVMQGSAEIIAYGTAVKIKEDK